MTNYSLSLIASGIAISIAFVQCNAPATTEAQVTSQLDTTILLVTAESNKYPGVTHKDKPRAIAINMLEATTVEPKAAITDRPEATTVEDPKETITDKPKLTTSENPKTATTDKPEVATVERPKAIITDKPEATTVENPKTTITDKPEATTVEKPTASAPGDFSLKSVKATVKGTSTLHDWESKVTIMEGKGSFQLKDNVLASIKDAEIKIAVNGIKSEEGRKMDNKTYETFESAKYPNIIYSFSNAVVKIDDSQVVSIETTGNLAMAGESKSVSLLANGKELPNGDLQLTVTKTIKMTDFNMKPPVMFLGTIKVGDEITVSFDFVLFKIKK